MGFGQGVEGRRHHPPRAGVDGRFADIEGQSRPGHRADAVPGPEFDAAAGRRQGDGGDNLGAVGDVRVVAGVLDDPGGGRFPAEGGPGEGEFGGLAAGQDDADRVRKASCQQGFIGAGGGGGGAGPRRPSLAQRFFAGLSGHGLNNVPPRTQVIYCPFNLNINLGTKRRTIYWNRMRN